MPTTRTPDAPPVPPVPADETDLDELLSRPQDTVPAREKARKTIVERYDLKTICLPKQLELVTPTTPTISQSGHPARPAT